VARRDQATALCAAGFTDVHSVGLPIAYASDSAVERLPGSLLVMPIHSLSDTSENFNSDAYADYISSIRSEFSEVVLCVHISCYTKGNWLDAFRKRGIPAVIGGDPEDINSYDRTAYLFRRFEYVTSNGWGSHIVYGSYFGAKVSVHGPRVCHHPQQYSGVTFYRNCPEALTLLTRLIESSHFEKTYPFIFTEPLRATLQTDWAADLVGHPMRRPPEELKRLLGWTLGRRLKYRWHSFSRRIRGKEF